MNTILRYLSGWMAVLTMAATPLHAADFEFGGRPPNGVFDPEQHLGAEITAEIAQPLPRLLAEEGVEVIVVVLGSVDDAPPEFVAGRFADAWCSAPVHAVVLHVPGHYGSPWIVPGGRSLDRIRREVISERLQMAHRNASREPTEAMKVRAAATEAADMLRFWLGNSLSRNELVAEAYAKRVRDAVRESRLRKIYVLIAGTVGMLLVVAFLLVMLIMRRPQVRRFPEIPAPKRLGAPHAGGNHAVIPLFGPSPPPHDES